jgi:hypothetical protein
LPLFPAARRDVEFPDDPKPMVLAIGRAPLAGMFMGAITDAGVLDGRLIEAVMSKRHKNKKHSRSINPGS